MNKFEVEFRKLNTENKKEEYSNERKTTRKNIS